jgi:hypothetical protein
MTEPELRGAFSISTAASVTYFARIHEGQTSLIVFISAIERISVGGKAMKRTGHARQIPSKISDKDLRFHEVGKGFILSKPAQDTPKGRRLITAYADQFNRSYIQTNGGYELITEQHSYLAVD